MRISGTSPGDATFYLPWSSAAYNYSNRHPNRLCGSQVMAQTRIESFFKKAKHGTAHEPDGARVALPLKHFSYGERTVVLAIGDCGGVVLRSTFRGMLLRHCRAAFVVRVAPEQRRGRVAVQRGSSSRKKVPAKAAGKQAASGCDRGRAAAGGSRGHSGGGRAVSKRAPKGVLSSVSTIADFTVECDDRAVGRFVESLNRRFTQCGVPPLHEVYCKWDGCHYLVHGRVGPLSGVMEVLDVPGRISTVALPVCERLRTELMTENGCMPLRVAANRVLGDSVVETKDVLEEVVLFLVEADLITTGRRTAEGGEMCVWFSARWLALDKDVKAMYKEILPDGGVSMRRKVTFAFGVGSDEENFM